MKFIRESEASRNVFEAPYKRTITHIITPWTAGSEHVWLGTCVYPPGFTSNPHAHESQEEVFYCIGGNGQIKVNDTVFDVVIGDTVFCSPGELHQCMNLNGTEDFKVVSVVTPPFTESSFKNDHTPKNDNTQ